MTPSLALQKALRERLTGDPAVLALVPAGNIFDRHGRPERFPCIVLGEGQETYADDFETFADRAFADLHLWMQEAGTTGVKALAGAVRLALKDRLAVDGFLCIALTVEGARYLRDPSGGHAHAVVSIEAILQATA